MVYHGRKIYSNELCLAIFEQMSENNIQSPYSKDQFCSLSLDKPIQPILLEPTRTRKTSNNSKDSNTTTNFRSPTGQKRGVGVNSDFGNKHYPRGGHRGSSGFTNRGDNVHSSRSGDGTNSGRGNTTSVTGRGSGNFSHSRSSGVNVSGRGGSLNSTGRAAGFQNNIRDIEKEENYMFQDNHDLLHHLNVPLNNNIPPLRHFTTSNRFVASVSDSHSKANKGADILSKLVDDLQIDDLDSQFDVGSPANRIKTSNNSGITTENFFNVADSFYSNHKKKHVNNRQLDRQNLDYGDSYKNESSKKTQQLKSNDEHDKDVDKRDFWNESISKF